MARAWRRRKAGAPFEEWDGSTEAYEARKSFEARQSYVPGKSFDRRGRRPLQAGPTANEIEHMIEAAVKGRLVRPGSGRRQLGRSPDTFGAATALHQIRTLDDLWSIWASSPAPVEPGERADD
jgi:hypothetical protein